MPGTSRTPMLPSCGPGLQEEDKCPTSLRLNSPPTRGLSHQGPPESLQPVLGTRAQEWHPSPSGEMARALSQWPAQSMSRPNPFLICTHPGSPEDWEKPVVSTSIKCKRAVVKGEEVLVCWGSGSHHFMVPPASWHLGGQPPTVS